MSPGGCRPRRPGRPRAPPARRPASAHRWGRDPRRRRRRGPHRAGARPTRRDRRSTGARGARRGRGAAARAGRRREERRQRVVGGPDGCRCRRRAVVDDGQDVADGGEGSRPTSTSARMRRSRARCSSSYWAWVAAVARPAGEQLLPQVELDRRDRDATGPGQLGHLHLDSIVPLSNNGQNSYPVTGSGSDASDQRRQMDQHAQRRGVRRLPHRCTGQQAGRRPVVAARRHGHAEDADGAPARARPRAARRHELRARQGRARRPVLARPGEPAGLRAGERPRAPPRLARVQPPRARRQGRRGDLARDLRRRAPRLGDDLRRHARPGPAARVGCGTVDVHRNSSRERLGSAA